MTTSEALLRNIHQSLKKKKIHFYILYTFYENSNENSSQMQWKLHFQSFH